MKVNLIFFLARFGLGGAGNSIFRLCTSLDKKKYKINIICLNKCAYEHKFRKNKIRVYKIKSNRTLYSMFKYLTTSIAGIVNIDSLFFF